MFKAARSVWYEKKLSKLKESELSKICKHERKLKVKPFSGKPLGLKFLREKRINGKRLIYLVYKEYCVVFIVTITNKKAQAKNIELIKKNLRVFESVIRKRYGFKSA